MHHEVKSRRLQWKYFYFFNYSVAFHGMITNICIFISNVMFLHSHQCISLHFRSTLSIIIFCFCWNRVVFVLSLIILENVTGSKIDTLNLTHACIKLSRTTVFVLSFWSTFISNDILIIIVISALVFAGLHADFLDVIFLLFKVFFLFSIFW
jgi:hypothetical protein